jgi:adenosine deaminase
MMRRTCIAVGLATLMIAQDVGAQRQSAPVDGSGATARYFSSVRGNPPLLLAFLTEMPKGGDLHVHLSGAIYAESYLRWAADDNLCLATATMTIVAGTCDAAAGRPPASAVLQNTVLYGQAIDAMSMRNWDRSLNGHDHFFAAFGKFGPSSAKTGDMLAEVSMRAAAEHVSYLELMLTPDGGLSTAKAAAAGWDPDLGRLRDTLLAAGFTDVVAAATRRLDEAERRERDLLRCGTPQEDAGCRVTVRYISQVARAAAPEAAFAQMLAGFEIATHDPRFVGLNLVQPEDAMIALRDFSLQMRMLDFLHSRYPRIAIALHAGELVDGLVPPEALRFHVGASVRTGHALRIGHGAGVMYEDGALSLVRDMASRRVLVEIALSSSDVILGVRGSRHPLLTYLKYGVPVALVTDDAGVARSSLTFEFRKAVEEHGLDYPTLKSLVRNSLDFSFADAGTKTRLRSDLDAAFRAFERRHGTRNPPS